MTKKMMNIVPIVSKLNGETETIIKNIKINNILNIKRNINHSFINFLLSFPHSHLEDLSISFKLYIINIIIMIYINSKKELLLNSILLFIFILKSLTNNNLQRD